MKSLKSRIYREPGIIKWEADIPSGARLHVYVMISNDGEEWTKTGPYTNPDGSRLNLPGPTKLKIHIESSPGPNGGPVLKKIWLHCYDDVLECGGDAGW